MLRVSFGLLLFVLACTPLGAADDVFAAAKKLGKGVNLGNALEAPNEGEWGIKLKELYFNKIKEAGFDSVRLPVRWSNHCGKDAPYTIDPKFFARVDWAIEQAEKNGLNIIVNAHHYDEIYQQPAEHLPRLLGIWRQIAERYKNASAHVYFELLNEPHSKLDDPTWNEQIKQLLKVVRVNHPQRPVIVGPSFWNGIWRLPHLKLPEEDRWLIATVHFYNPFEFTHQGAHWVEKSDKWKGTVWPKNADEEKKLVAELGQAAQWGKENKRPMFLGEFGAFSAAEMESRVRWTKTVVETANQLEISWSYWEFCSGFGAFDPETDQWREPLRKALTGR